MIRDQLKKLERDLWAAADKLRANSDLKASEYSTLVAFAASSYLSKFPSARYFRLPSSSRQRAIHVPSPLLSLRNPIAAPF